ncbi:hypothetical protein EG68_09676 [Paragonimus skrjabini miyazakii]|uniref:non-specific serine/threonine protein kinase n=1 Tax=Paragonimus skrjabini miyazakii TaxID=59628 RepID=A0A8S9YT53_9TREM|nr:hypothetical protein EG68_09676 [Paragonimus skrjabini miyazakii]
MKKILARLAQADSDDLANSHNSQSGNLNRHYASFLGRHFRIGHFSLIVDEIIAEGGFGVVFRVHSQQGQYYALKRTCVNCERDLALCKREVTIVSSLSHKNILRYVDSRINRVREGIFEVLLLTAYYPGNWLIECVGSVAPYIYCIAQARVVVCIDIKANAEETFDHADA